MVLFSGSRDAAIRSGMHPAMVRSRPNEEGAMSAFKDPFSSGRGDRVKVVMGGKYQQNKTC